MIKIFKPEKKIGAASKKNLMKTLFTTFLLLIATSGFAQTDSLKKNPLSFGGYVETYYSYDFNTPADHNRPIIYSHNRHNEFALNLGLLQAEYETDKVRANLGIMVGTYPNANLAEEPGVLKNIFEANAGVKISNKKNLWVDAGIFPSHIGWESAIGSICPTLTRSMAAENSPYYESGAKISYTSDNDKWYMSGLFLNGWQKIQRIDGNNTPAFGHQLTFMPNDKVSINSSSFIGNVYPDINRRQRYFHDLYSTIQLSKQTTLTAAFDIGAEQKFKGSKSYNSWYTAALILQIKADEKNGISLRGEYYSDENEVLVATGTANGFKTWGYSANYDRVITENFMWRIEARGFTGKDKTFVKNGNAVNNNFALTTSLAISF